MHTVRMSSLLNVLYSNLQIMCDLKLSIVTCYVCYVYEHIHIVKQFFCVLPNVMKVIRHTGVDCRMILFRRLSMPTKK